jgi:hypothetical protein
MEAIDGIVRGCVERKMKAGSWWMCSTRLQDEKKLVVLAGKPITRRSRPIENTRKPKRGHGCIVERRGTREVGDAQRNVPEQGVVYRVGTG